ncbi:MAG: outer membrane lipoprotein-sorting protein [Chlorobium sp.]|nr:MAG: outer membrane lipoprotein-sorting protein [Chlorobium sp.]
MYNYFSRAVFRNIVILTICAVSGFCAGNHCLGAVAGNNTVSQSSVVSAEEILKKADEFRSPWPDYNMTATLSYKKEAVEEREIFRVFVKNHVKTLVSYIEPQKQRGNMLLMVDDNLWYYVHKTQRPMRITPVQKLSGGASYGDITKLDWSRDYLADNAGTEKIEFRDRTYEAWHLRLTARSRSATYHTVDLYIEKETGYPRKAVVYLQSGKKMKTLYFSGYNINAGKMMNTRIDFVDHLAGDRETSLIFSKVSVRKSPDSFFLNTSLPSIYSEVVF